MQNVAENGVAKTGVVQIGRFWFQNRSLAPLPFLALVVFLKPNVQWSPVVSIAWVVAILLSEGLRLWAVGHVGSQTRTRTDVVPVLFHAGPYLYCRNPLYIANILLYTLITIFFGFTYLAPVVFLYSCMEYYFIVAYEEDLLATLFGKPYQDYCEKVPRWIPKSLTPQYASSGETFNFKKGLRSERSTIMLLGLLLILWALKKSL